MAKQYVERELAIGAVEYVANKDTRIYSSENKYSEIIQALSEAPAADVEPVRHGVWIERSDKGILNMRCPYMCNICGRVEAVKEPYCNCGARMDGGNNE